jgi:hypothetical protein
MLAVYCARVTIDEVPTTPSSSVLIASAYAALATIAIAQAVVARTTVYR